VLPVIALVGRPNVGKSTLFNYLTRSRDALVADIPGLTRDRRYGYGRVGGGRYIVVDTGGLAGETGGLEGLMARQTLLALDESDLVFFLVDAREGLTAADEEVARLLRERGATVRLIVNKAEGLESGLAAADFFGLGFGQPSVISAAHGDRVGDLMEEALAGFPEAEEAPPEEDVTRVAVIGRPNVGKSTLINRMIGEERVLAFDLPGTTRDSVDVPFERDGRHYVLVDTAGIRRRSRIDQAIEKFSVIKALQAIDSAQVVIAVLDAAEGVTEQDASLLGLAVQRGRAMVIAVNKWDGLDPDQRETVRRQIDLRLPFVDFAPIHFISALHGSGVGNLLGDVDAAREAAFRDMPTAALTQALEEAVMAHAPPTVRGRRIKLRYAHQGGRNPPTVVIHGTQAERLPGPYRRYLINTFRRVFGLAGTPVRIELRSPENPYAGRRRKLTPRQERDRKRRKQLGKGKKR